jgi:hypothetical protein
MPSFVVRLLRYISRLAKPTYAVVAMGWSILPVQRKIHIRLKIFKNRSWRSLPKSRESDPYRSCLLHWRRTRVSNIYIPPMSMPKQSITFAYLMANRGWRKAHQSRRNANIALPLNIIFISLTSKTQRHLVRTFWTTSLATSQSLSIAYLVIRHVRARATEMRKWLFRETNWQSRWNHLSGSIHGNGLNMILRCRWV